MGAGLIRHLLRAGHQVTIYNRTRAKAEALGKDGARVADTPAAAVRGAEAAFTMLADDPAVAAATFGENGLLAGLDKSAFHISSSTISIEFARKLAEEHGKHGSGFVSAPVFGRPDAAEAKKLVVVTAGPVEVVERARPLLDAIGRATFVAGVEPWHANLLKLCGNFMIASLCETFGEAFATLRKAGADHQVFFEAITEVFGSPVYKNYGASIANSSFEPAGFALKLGLKDVRQVLDAASEFDVAMPFGSILRDHFLSALAHGQEQMDWSSIALVPARAAGVIVQHG